MPIQNVEIKARCLQPEAIRDILKQHEADYKGTDHQVDTYFNVGKGRLKLRKGTIENNLIFYHRPDTASPKLSEIHLVPMEHTEKMKALLTAALGVKIKVEKQREIYFIKNIKFHIDTVEKLGNFIEVEAIDADGTIGKQKLKEQCRHYLDLFEIDKADLVAVSYSDLLAGK